MGTKESKYLVRYYPKKPYDSLNVWNLDILNIRNPESAFYRDEVLAAYSQYEKARDLTSGKDGSWVKDIDGSLWLYAQDIILETIFQENWGNSDSD